MTTFFRAICLTAFLTLTFSGLPELVAQEGTGSHRRLSLPRNSPNSPQQQLAKLLQYLQAIKKENLDEKLTPEQAASELEDLKQQFGPQLGGMLDQVPEEVAQQAMQDPQMRNQIKEMLKDFSQTRRLPNFTPGQNSSAPPSPDDSQRTRGTPDDQRSPNRPQPDSDPRLPRSPPPQQEPSEADSNRPATPARPRPDEAGRTEPDPSLPESLQERLRQMREQWLRDRQNKPSADQSQTDVPRPGETGREEASQRPSSSLKQPDASGTAEMKASDQQQPMTIDDLLDRIRQQREANARNGSANGGRTNQGTSQPDPRENRRPRTEAEKNLSGNEASGQSGRGSSNDEEKPSSSLPFGDRRGDNSNSEAETPEELLDRLGGLNGNGSLPSLKEFLDQTQGEPDVNLRDLGITLPSDFNQSAGGNGQSPNSRSGNDGRLADTLQKLNTPEMRQKAREALENQGLRSLLKDVMKGAKESARTNNNSEGGIGGFLADVAQSTGMEEQVLGALGGMTEEMAEAARNSKTDRSSANADASRERSNDRKASGAASRKNAPTEPPRTGPGQPSSDDAKSNRGGSSNSNDDKSVFSQITESASDAFEEFTQAPEASPASGASTPELPVDFEGASFASIIVICLLIIVFMAALFVGPQLIPKSSEESSEQVIASLLQQGIRTKEDVIRAFHQFALKPPHDTQHWWTHSRVVESVADQYPQSSNRIRILSSLYEQARYLPEDTEFTDAMFQEAADVVRTVGVA